MHHLPQIHDFVHFIGKLCKILVINLFSRVGILALIILNIDVSFKVIKEKEEKKLLTFIAIHCGWIVLSVRLIMSYLRLYFNARKLEVFIAVLGWIHFQPNWCAIMIRRAKCWTILTGGQIQWFGWDLSTLLWHWTFHAKKFSSPLITGT